MRFLAILPMLTAVAAVCCALWPPARRVIWPVVALAAVNVVLTPLTSGEWFYQREEDAYYERAVAKGDFTAFDRLLAAHDPHLHPRMIAMAVVLLVPLIVLGVLKVREHRGEHVSAATRAVVAGTIVLAALVTAVQAGLLIL